MSSSPRPTSAETHELISKMLDFEAAARKNGIDFTSGRFRMLTASERTVLRAELVADYIRLSAGNLSDTPGYYDAALLGFSSKICDMSVPSHELMGTYLAAAEIVKNEPKLRDMPGLADSVRDTMLSILQACADMMHKKSEQSAAVASR